jgi:hypothetical protein
LCARQPLAKTAWEYLFKSAHQPRRAIGHAENRIDQPRLFKSLRKSRQLAVSSFVSTSV